MASLSGFDARNVPPQVPFEPIPNGKYQAAIVESEFKPTANGNGSYLQLKMQIVAGEHQGRTIFDRLNLNNPSDQTVGIARATLSAICRAVGVLTPNDSSELHNRPMLVKVAVKKRQDNGELSNEVKGYEPIQSAPSAPRPMPAAGPASAPAPQSAPAQQGGAPRPTASGPPPWARPAAPVAAAQPPAWAVPPEQMADEAAKAFA